MPQTKSTAHRRKTMADSILPMGILERIASGDIPSPPLAGPAIAGAGTAGNAGIDNPGAVFDDLDSAARDILGQINPMSKAQNREYGWGFYHDRDTGKIGYTDPIAIGLEGTDFRPFTSDNQVPIGMGHTHGNYSSAAGIATTRDADEYNSDDFSTQERMTDKPGDIQFMRRGPQTFTYYLGTPSGKFRKWTPWGGMENLP
jgi:hypothetical protein